MESAPNSFDFEALRTRFRQLLAPFSPVDTSDQETAILSVVIPVNAKADLTNVFYLLDDISRYEGSLKLDFVIVVNNYESASPPVEFMKRYEDMGIRIVAIPDLRPLMRPGSAIPLTGRIAGIREAQCKYVVSFDADCRIPDPTALLDWYREAFRAGAVCAYSHVAYFDFKPHPITYARLFAHHLSRYMKRHILRIPTTRGSNYGVDGPLLVKWYDADYIAVDLQVGPVLKVHGKVSYSGRRAHQVFTSGRVFDDMRSWRHLTKYLVWRLRRNVRMLRVGGDAALRVGEERLKRHYEE